MHPPPLMNTTRGYFITTSFHFFLPPSPLFMQWRSGTVGCATEGQVTWGSVDLSDVRISRSGAVFFVAYPRCALLNSIAGSWSDSVLSAQPKRRASLVVYCKRRVWLSLYVSKLPEKEGAHVNKSATGSWQSCSKLSNVRVFVNKGVSWFGEAGSFLFCLFAGHLFKLARWF